RRIRLPLPDQHYRERPRHSAREHHHHQPRRSPRPQRALSASRPRRPIYCRPHSDSLIPPEQQLTEIARRRLAALKEFSDLGAGFKIAALDLELRGAGNMLGGEQSGHIEAVGFEMYTSMLEQAVSKLKGEEKRDHITTQLNLGISLRIDESYIPEENQ